MPAETLSRIPTHAAIIVDGNRRWARQRMMPASFGHKAGFDRLKEITRYAVGDRVEHATFGVGVIRRIETLAADYKLVVDFGDAGVKTLLAKFAKLTRL